MKWIEYVLSRAYVTACWLVCFLLPVNRNKVVFASARSERLTGNLKYVDEYLASHHPEMERVYLLERYGYSLGAKIRYALGLARGVYHLCTARLFLMDNAYFPVHVVPHKKKTQVVQLWHAVGAMKKAGLDDPDPARKQENKFVHKRYDWVVMGAPFAQAPYASMFRMRPEQVLTLGSPRADLLFDPVRQRSERARLYAAFPCLKGKKVILYAPTYRGEGVGKKTRLYLDAKRLKQRLGDGYLLVLKPHPTAPSERAEGYDLVADDTFEINDWFTVTDVLITDYSSSALEFAALEKPMVLLVPDRDEYCRHPGFYFDFAAEMAGDQVTDTDQAADLILSGNFDFSRYPAFIARHFAHRDSESARRVTEFLLSL